MKPQLEIIVDYKGKTRVFRNGVEVALLRSVQFSSSVEEVPVITLEQYIADETITKFGEDGMTFQIDGRELSKSLIPSKACSVDGAD